MIELYIDNKRAQVKESTSIKLVDENTYLTESSKYTYDIELPLKGSPDNARIFGNIHRLDVSKKAIKMEARLIADNRDVINGTATVTGITDSSVKIQILAGNAELNFLSKYDKLFIDELDLGNLQDEDGKGISPDGVINYLTRFPESERYKMMFGTYDQTDYVFFPVYNEAKDYILNDVCFHKMSETTETVFWRTAFYGATFGLGSVWASTGRSAIQPYLCFIIKRIFAALGYELVENQIENTPLKNVFIVNARSVTSYNKMLPHWTVSEFMEQVENFYGVAFKTDDNSKKVRVLQRDSLLKNENVYIKQVVDAYSVTCDDEDTTDISNGNVSYAFEEVDKYIKIEEDVLKRSTKEVFDTYAELYDFYTQLSEDQKKKYIYEAEGKQYIQYDGSYLREVNQYRNLMRNEESDGVDIELKIIPVRMTTRRTRWEGCAYDDFFKHFYPTQGEDFNTVMMTVSGSEQFADGNQNIQDMIEGNTINETTKDVLEVAMNDGVFQPVQKDDGSVSSSFPWPFVLTDDPLNGSRNRGFSFELNKIAGRTTMYDMVFGSVMKINTQNEIVIKFITDQIYDTMKRFIMGNKPYICKQIEYKIDDKGIDPEKTGYFFEVAL